MTSDDFLRFDSEADLRLELSRRVRQSLVEGMLADGASAAEVDEQLSALTEMSAGLVDALGLSVSGEDNTVRVCYRRQIAAVSDSSTC